MMRVREALVGDAPALEGCEFTTCVLDQMVPLVKAARACSQANVLLAFLGGRHAAAAARLLLSTPELVDWAENVVAHYAHGKAKPEHAVSRYAEARRALDALEEVAAALQQRGNLFISIGSRALRLSMALADMQMGMVHAAWSSGCPAGTRTSQRQLRTAFSAACPATLPRRR